MVKPKIVTFATSKGGSIKTTATITVAEDLAKQNKKVLLWDKDEQCNLTHFYDVYEDEGTVAEVYKDEKNGEVKVINVAPNIDLIAGSMILDEYESKLVNDKQQDLKFYTWLQNNAGKVDFGKYDYILIDCHPDFGIATRNAIVVSHVVITPVVPGDFSIEGVTSFKIRFEKFKEQTVDKTTKETLVTAKHYFLPSKIARNRSSRKLQEFLDTEENTIKGVVPYKVLFEEMNKDNTIIDMMEKMGKWKSQKKFFDTLRNTLDQVEKLIDEA
ncbi:ParA family protein [Listeria monocytogenes]